MPKNVQSTKTQRGVVKTRVRAKLRIGGRKSGKSAFSFTNDALVAVLGDKSKRRWHQNARTVLRMRGVAVA